jgi:Family of unknown function (DUF6081)
VNGGLPGGLDHVKWLAYMNHVSAAGIAGFGVLPGQELTCETWISGRTFGTAAHPFGTAIFRANDDLRLASVAMNTIDFETFMVFDFFLTNEGIYALYERLPFGRTASDNYAAFTYQVRVASRSPGDSHHLRISHDRTAGTVRWSIGGTKVFRVSRLGRRLDRADLT